MISPRVFVVTGSNKGIGKSIVKLLLQDKEEKIVYLTSRNEDLGKLAVQDLKRLGLEPQYHQLDITDKESIETLKNYLLEKYDGLDVLVNNAGIAYKQGATSTAAEEGEVINGCNFYGTLAICNALFPIIKKNGRVVNVSSTAGEFAYNKLSSSLKSQFADPMLTIKGLRSLMQEFIQSMKDDSVEEKGFPKKAYGMSKLAVSLMSKIQQKEMDKNSERKILINFCCPGYVDTDLIKGINMPFQPINTDEGADTPVFLALIPINSDSPRGCYYKLRKLTSFPPQ